MDQVMNALFALFAVLFCFNRKEREGILAKSAKNGLLICRDCIDFWYLSAAEEYRCGEGQEEICQ